MLPANSLNTIESEVEDISTQEESETSVEADDSKGSGGTAGDTTEPEVPNTHRRYFPSSIGLTVLLNPEIKAIEADVSWGDYRPVPSSTKTDSDQSVAKGGKKKEKEQKSSEHWVRIPEQRKIKIPIVNDGRGSPIQIPNSSGSINSSGGLEIDTYSHEVNIKSTDGTSKKVRVLSVFLVNRRSCVDDKKPDSEYAFQARLELICESGIEPREDYSNSDSKDWDLRVADLHYRNSFEWAVGSNVAAGWNESIEQSNNGVEFSNFSELKKVKRVWTDPLPVAEVKTCYSQSGQRTQ